MSRFPVQPKKEKALLERMARLQINEKDLLEQFVRSSGKGGRHVNSSSTCVYLKHVPSGKEVKVQRSRNQGLNRFLARRLLLDRLEEEYFGMSAEKTKAREQIRRRKSRGRRRAVKKRMQKEREMQ